MAILIIEDEIPAYEKLLVNLNTYFNKTIQQERVIRRVWCRIKQLSISGFRFL